MHRIEGDGFVVVGGKNQFTEGNPLIPTPATMVTADWANAAQEEIALTIEGLGGTLNTAATDTTPNQLLTRLNAKFGRLDLANAWAASNVFNVASGTANAIEARGTGAATTGALNLGMGGLFVGAGGTPVTDISTNAGSYSIGGDTSSSGIGGIGAVGRGGTPAAAPGGVGVVGVGGVPDSGNFAGGNGVNGIGASGSGTGAGGQGVMGTGANAVTTNQPGAAGVRGLGGNGNGTGAHGAGGTFASPVAATGGARQIAIQAENGDISLDGVANPTSTTALKNRLTPRNFTKASATIKVSNSNGTITVEDAMNVTSVALNGTLLRITFAQAFASAAYQVTFGVNDSWAGPMAIFWRAKAAGTLDIAASQMDGTAISFATVNAYFDVSVTGAQ